MLQDLSFTRRSQNSRWVLVVSLFLPCSLKFRIRQPRLISSRENGDRLLKRIPKEYQTRFLNDTGTNDQDKSGVGGKGKSRMIEEASKSSPHDILYEIQSSLDQTESVNHSTVRPAFLFLLLEVSDRELKSRSERYSY